MAAASSYSASRRALACLAVAVPDLHPAFIADTQQLLAARLPRRYGLKRGPPAHIEVIVMAIRQRPRRAGSPVRRVLDRWARALRDLHDEQAYAWECFFRPAGAPRPARRLPPPPGGSHAPAGSGTPPPPGGSHAPAGSRTLAAAGRGQQ